MAQTRALIKTAEEEQKGLLEKLESLRETVQDVEMVEYVSTLVEPLPPPPSTAFKAGRDLRGHQDKVYSVSWCADNRQLVSAGQDGKLIVWDAWEGEKTHSVSLASRWVLTCAFSPSAHHVVAGGLDNKLTLYELVEDTADGRLKTELVGHDGYISSCAFLDETRLVSTSGDETAVLWDIEKKAKVVTFSGHDGNVNALSVSADKRTLLTGGNDKTCRLWDLRDGKAKQTFFEHTMDVNGVSFFPNDLAFGTACEDQNLRLFDLRADQCLMTYSNEAIPVAASSVAFSLSGRLIFGGFNDRNTHAFDALTGHYVVTLGGQTERVSCLARSNDGDALAAGSWDKSIRIWNAV